MANICIILGESGTGKTSSLRTLDPKDTIIINVLGKRLPFKSSQALYNSSNKNLFNVQNAADIVSLIHNISEKTKCRNLVIDDMSYVMRTEYFARAKEAGYAKYTDIAVHTQQIIKACQDARNDLNVYFIYHAEAVTDNAGIVGWKVATIGKLLDAQYNPVEVVPVVLFSTVKFDDKNIPTYGFITRRTKDGSVTIPAKSPDGMFDDEFIANDLGLVASKMEEYYS